MIRQFGIKAILSKILTGIYLALILNIKGSSGWWTNPGVRVSNASLQPQINGQYYLTTARCNNYEVWAEDTSYSQHYISYVKTRFENETEVYNWAIGTTMFCIVDPNQPLALNRPDGAKSKPYDLPTMWYERFNSTSQTYVPNPYLMVEEVHYLSVGEIIGIILGCLCLGLLLLSLNFFICSKINEHKRRRTTPASTSVPGRYNRRGDRSSRREEGLSLPPSYTPGVFVTPVEPPQYDNQPPPSYETVQLQKRLETSECELPTYSTCVTGLADGIPQCCTPQSIGSVIDGVYQLGEGARETNIAASVRATAHVGVINESNAREGVAILDTRHLRNVTAREITPTGGGAANDADVSIDATSRAINITDSQSVHDNAGRDERSLVASAPAPISTSPSRLINVGLVNNSFTDDTCL